MTDGTPLLGPVSTFVRERVARRAGHFLKADLVDSQLRTLEEPAGAITVDAAAPPEVIVAQLRAALGR